MGGPRKILKLRDEPTDIAVHLVYSDGTTRVYSLQAARALRVPVREAARMLGIGRSTLYERIHQGRLRLQKDGHLTYISTLELQRYVRLLDEAKE